MDFLNGLKRTKMCAEFSANDIGKNAVVMGFVAKYRNLGNLLFIDLRDRTGIVQVAFDISENTELFEKATTLRNEFVLCCVGTVRSRGGNINKNIATGEIEVLASDLRILSEAEVTPFVVNDEINVGEALRLKYRYLDLRRPYLQQRLAMRSKVARIARNFLADNGFLEVETPFLGKSTPEGARDYLVPSRVHQGEFYALPQSPQIFKQLLMLSGCDRYYQIAKCFRDEDLRANRQPEFSQIDMEMSFVENCEDVMEVAEAMIKEIFSECCGLSFTQNFKKMSYRDAIEKYGSDKPDTRFALEIIDVSEIARLCEFSVFSQAVEGGGVVRAINAKGLASKMTRKDFNNYAEFVKTYGAKGLAWVSIKEDGQSSSFLKFMTEQQQSQLLCAVGAEVGDAVFFVADKKKIVCNALGALRQEIAKTFELYDKNSYDFLWVVDFPLLEYSEDDGRFYAMHHPFTSVKIEDIGLIDDESRFGEIRANAYDLVINGEEAGGGSIRIHNTKMQNKMFEMLGMSADDIANRFGFFADAFKYGAPPHGGLAFGLDRLVMLVTKTDNIKDVIAFPKVQNASCLMTDAPSAVEAKQLTELGLNIKK